MSLVIIFIFSGYWYEWKVIPSAETEALRVLWCRNRLSFHFFKFAEIFVFELFISVGGAGVWRYGSIFSYLNFFKLLLCNRNYWFIKSIFVMFSLLIITISNYWLLPMILCVYVNLFGPLGWSILRYRVFCFFELWWKKRWLDWWIRLCLQKLIVQVLAVWRIHDSLGEDITFLC